MAHRSSKEQVYEYLEQITKEFDFEHLTRYTTLDICNKLNMSRSLVSLYLLLISRFFSRFLTFCNL